MAQTPDSKPKAATSKATPTSPEKASPGVLQSNQQMTRLGGVRQDN